MPKKAENLIGKTYGELTVIEKIPDDTHRRRYDRWICKCSCGEMVRVRGFYLRNGMKTSCNNIIHSGNKDCRFGRLTIILGKEKKQKGRIYYFCKCDCGNIIYVPKNKLVSGHTQSCGCLRNEKIKTSSITHGMTYTRLYRTWRGMISRCECPGDGKSYLRYGARGISVCEEWHSFESFYEWAKNSGYSDDLSIERIDNNGNYCPENCRWATNKEQANNRRNSLWIEYNGETKTLAQWAEEYHLPYKTLYYRYIYMKWNIEKALTQPIQKSKKNEG